ncbi:4-(cytidine 5'-diphospho)-2-C-methyl-D-erythritol kinase [Clostridium aminobutyricum]|uniref:4-diphosphocytidyl-2-C-methyl-D-erythritol kinase n=1 Tax=Clostridium aminobutyricum TaxID=33953 RepID=A0A939D9Z4_CLOAM|nr:4-(cytidine 5'-diphospho)-2-C-methyl-D-erythritol kinase [Clostridium aminobutyricum]MBN7774124.1 4-(cytidine 5'-diphospho)-2-C-methyl-D-erythritol kinase [Clostridium aminobutyricum]
MKEIVLKAFAKINLSLDVLGVLPNGYHEVRMVMQQVELHDLVTVRWQEIKSTDLPERIVLMTDRTDLPADGENIAFKAAELMMKRFGKTGQVQLFIEKHIPVAAGLAGGSADGAAVLHGLNFLWDLNLTIAELCEIGVQIGADLPFCIMGQARGNTCLGILSDDRFSAACALAEGIGEKLQPLPSLDCWIVLSKPPISISTAEVYQGIDQELDGNNVLHPDSNTLIQGLFEKNHHKIVQNMVNILELFTLKRYPIIVYTKNLMDQQGPMKTLMSGSGPTVFAIYLEKSKAEDAFKTLCQHNQETFITKTLL